MAHGERQMKKRNIMVFLLAGALFLFTVVPAQALKYGFDNITNNIAADADIGEAQLFVNVTGAGNQVLFTFENTGPEASSICDVYFDDASLSLLDRIALIDNSSTGVTFSQGASPGNLPGANEVSPPFVTTAGFLADSNSPAQPNGVNPGEYLGILFDLQANLYLSDVYEQLASGELRIGIHVQGFDSGGSESFINDPEPVPEPTTMLLFGTGIAGLVGSKIRKKKK